MSNSVQIETRIRIIAAELEKGLSTSEIINTYTANWQVSEPTLKRYIALARDIVMGKLNDANAIIEAVRGNAIAEEAEKNLRSNMELEAMLVAIIEGELIVEKIIEGPQGITEIKSKPTRAQVMKAIDLIWKKRGLYRQAPITQAASDGKKEYKVPNIVVKNEEQRKLVEAVFKLP